MDKLCDVCGGIFNAMNSQKRCSAECQKVGRRTYAREYYRSPLNRGRLTARNKEYRDATPERQLLKGAKWRSYKRGEVCDLEEADIVIPVNCPILGVELTKEGRYGPTLDRKDSSKGYVKDNIWVISKLANMMKSDSTPEEQRKFAEWVKTQAQFQKTSITS